MTLLIIPLLIILYSWVMTKLNLKQGALSWSRCNLLTVPRTLLAFDTLTYTYIVRSIPNQNLMLRSVYIDTRLYVSLCVFITF